MSEYALGRVGRLMWPAYCMALGWPASAAGGRAGLVLLGLAGVGAAGAGLFRTDPVTTPPEEVTRTGRLHALFGVPLILWFPPAATLISRDLAGGSARTGPRAWLPWLVTLSWVGMLGYVVATIRYPFGPGRPIGWLQRVMVLTYLAWLLVIAGCGGR